MTQTTTVSDQKKQCNKHYANTIGTVVKKLRATAHLSLNECFRETGINFSMVESQGLKPGTQCLCRICKFFNISKAQFFYLVEKHMGDECSFFPGSVPTHENVIKYEQDIQNLFPKPQYINN